MPCTASRRRQNCAPQRMSSSCAPISLRLRGADSNSEIPGSAEAMAFGVPNQFRVRTGYMASDERAGCNGVFRVPNLLARKVGEPPLLVIASDEAGWEHVSVSLPNRCPTWPEMCLIKGMFWGDEDCVVQFHPLESEYVNNHPYCLHLWRPSGQDIPTPPSLLVGIRP